MRLIDADKLKKHYAWWEDDRQELFDSIVDQQQTVDAVPVIHGHWIYGNDFHWYTASCNKCGYQRRTDIKADRWNQWNYCPNCGARMDDAKEEIL